MNDVSNLERVAKLVRDLGAAGVLLLTFLYLLWHLVAVVDTNITKDLTLAEANNTKMDSLVVDQKQFYSELLRLSRENTRLGRVQCRDSKEALHKPTSECQEPTIQ